MHQHQQQQVVSRGGPLYSYPPRQSNLMYSPSPLHQGGFVPFPNQPPVTQMAPLPIHQQQGQGQQPHRQSSGHPPLPHPPHHSFLRGGRGGY
jgi:hypothetical protein